MPIEHNGLVIRGGQRVDCRAGRRRLYRVNFARFEKGATSKPDGDGKSGRALLGFCFAAISVMTTDGRILQAPTDASSPVPPPPPPLARSLRGWLALTKEKIAEQIRAKVSSERDVAALDDSK